MTELPSGAFVEVSSTPECSVRDAFEQWEHLLSNTLVPVSVAPVGGDSFFGRARFTAFDQLAVSSFRSSGLFVRRSARQVAQSEGEFLSVMLVSQGRALIEHGGRSVEGRPGTMVLFSTGMPYAMQLAVPATAMVVVQVPMAVALESSGLTPDRLSAVIDVPLRGAAGVVAQYLRGLCRLSGDDVQRATVLGAPSIDLLSGVVSLAVDAEPSDESARELAKQQVEHFIRTNYADPALTVDDIARACHLSRRSLFRLFRHTDDRAAMMLRRVRVERARELLSAKPFQPIAAIGYACGFRTERQFYRVFRQETGQTPGEYRASRQGRQ
ncbi:helix-turn-helix domain-containing protein [Nocardia arthritidis]|uniref:AraC-like ligand-binding domain-containing protein n=1 Tax=Nocardia arthritidis TaxID=228602 RepID=UPI00142E86EA|nr:AraC family transcriptional regulator [Nocardia arthritidis]